MHLEKLLRSPDFRAVFLPIKPRYIKLILSGKKTVEYRRRTPAKPFSVIVLYSSFPEKKIVGIVEVVDVTCGSKGTIWRDTASVGGVTKLEYDTYFDGAEKCCRIRLGSLIKVTPVSPSRIKRGFVVPQSFRYLEAPFVKKIHELSD